MMETRSLSILPIAGTLHSSMHNATGYFAEHDESQTDDIWCYLGVRAQIQQRTSVQRKLCWQTVAFFVEAWGLAEMLPPCPSLRETILG